MLERSLAEAREIFGRYLTFEGVKSGEALAAARSDYKDALRKRQAEDAIPQAWRHLVEEPDALLIDLLSETAQKLCGYAPERDQIVAFLHTLRADSAFPKPIPPAPTPVPPSPTERLRPSEPSDPGGTRHCSFSLRGKNYPAGDATDAMVQILQLLHREDSTFLERLVVRVRGRNRNHIARSKMEVYPGRRDLLDYTREIVSGWWVGTNIANREKRRIIERGCEVAGIRFGRDLIIDIH